MKKYYYFKLKESNIIKQKNENNIKNFWILKLNKKILLLLLKFLFMLIIIKYMYLQKLNKKNDNNGKINENLLKRKIKESYELMAMLILIILNQKLQTGDFGKEIKMY